MHKKKIDIFDIEYINVGVAVILNDKLDIGDYGMNKIETNRFVLRKVNENDEIDIFEILSDKDVIKNLNMKIHKSIDDTRKIIQDYLIGLEKGEKYPFAIIDKNTREFIGVFLIKLDLFDEDCYEFTVYIKKEYWNKGIYTEVLKPMTKFAFEEVKTGNFRGFVMEKNIASSRVLEKSNFKLEKVFNVEGIESKIKSYLIRKDEYEKISYLY